MGSHGLTSEERLERLTREGVLDDFDAAAGTGLEWRHVLGRQRHVERIATIVADGAITNVAQDRVARSICNEMKTKKP